jgi:PleD family two-component response regulator
MAFQKEGDVSLTVEGDEFRSRLAEEIKRSERYEHPFTVLILRPPRTSGKREMAGSPWFDSLVRSLVRGCDVVAVFEDEPAVAVLLPETAVSGASALLERLMSIIPDANHEWGYTLLEYPLNREKIENFMDQAA